MPSSAYLQALDSICQPIRARSYPQSLHPLFQLLDALGSPHRQLRAVVVAGSTGKGTTCLQIAQFLRPMGFTVGLYTSPHLHSFRERFVIDASMITEEAFVQGAKTVNAAAASLGQRYSTFEQATALAFWWFAQRKPDWMVLEIGLGGRFDGVNTVENQLAVFTPIENEHAAMLGGSLQSIAWHKAGIIQPGGHAVTATQTAEVMTILRQEADEKNARLEVADGALARAACHNLSVRGLIPPLSADANFAFRNLPGRLEQVKVGGRLILIDGGHTPAAARHLRQEVERLAGPSQQVRLIVGMLQDKSAHDYLAQFDTPRYEILLTRAPSQRAATLQYLMGQANLNKARLRITESFEAAFALALDETAPLVVIAGSLRLAAAAREAIGLLDSEALAEAQATRRIFEGEDYLARLVQEP